MNEKGNGVLCKYNFVVNKTGRAKGAVLLDTNQGFFLLKEFTGTKKHLEFEENLLNRISELGKVKVDSIIRDKDGNIVNEDVDGKKYVLHKWYDAKDMEVKNIEQIIHGASTLGKLHTLMNKIAYENNYLNECFNIEEIKSQLSDEFIKHNREIKRTRAFVREKRRKNEFELLVLSSFDKFYTDALEVAEKAKALQMSQFIEDNLELGRIVHGAYNYHNLIISDNQLMVINFEHTKCGVQIRDLYDYLRKVMEKHGWNQELGRKIFDEYNINRNVSEVELKYLILKLKYPEKYWKIINHYNNTNKAWIPDKDLNKLKSVIIQQEKRRDFVKSLLNFS